MGEWGILCTIIEVQNDRINLSAGVKNRITFMNHTYNNVSAFNFGCIIGNGTVYCTCSGVYFEQ